MAGKSGKSRFSLRRCQFKNLAQFDAENLKTISGMTGLMLQPVGFEPVTSTMRYSIKGSHVTNTNDLGGGGEGGGDTEL